jgi:hypothetical protein
MTQKNYGLLRPFDEKAAKAGAAICFETGSLRRYLGGPDKDGIIHIETDCGPCFAPKGLYRMAPISWEERSE